MEPIMRNTTSKPAIAALMALSLTASVFATAEPASAASWHGGGRGGGGWHGGGWHGGGWRGGGWHGGWAGPAVVGGLAAGALLAAPYYGYGYGYGPTYGYGYGNCSYAPIYDAYGNFIGNQPVC